VDGESAKEKLLCTAPYLFYVVFVCSWSLKLQYHKSTWWA